MPTMPTERDARICQHAAEALWNAATSERHDIAAYDSGPYRALERAFLTSVRVVYGLSSLKTARVRDLLAELGPRDAAHGTSGYGVASYVEYVKANRYSTAYDR